MRSRITRFATAAAVLAGAGVATIGLASGPAAFAGPPLGSNTLNPTSGTGAATNFTMTPPSGASCTGGGAAGYRWQSYFVDSGVDASTLTYAAGPNPVSGHFVSPLFDATDGSAVQNQSPANTPAGLIAVANPFNFSGAVGVVTTAGSYKIGIACTQAGNLEAGHYWETPITITNVTATNFNWSFGGVPSAPTITATGGDQTIAGNVTAAGTSVPATTSFTVTAHPTGGGADLTTTVTGASGGAYSFSAVPYGAYQVSAKANNTAGASSPSNVVTVNSAPASRPPVTGLAFAQGANGAPTGTISWTAPTGTAPTGYTVSISPTITGSPFTTTTTSQAVTCTIGTAYTATVTPTHTAPFVGTPASITYTCNASQIIVQDVTVVRPVGALVLTQRCGVNGALAATTADADFPALPLIPASADQVGTAPTTGALPGGPADPQFNNYPNPSPASYPTHCGVDLGTAQLITSGAHAGQYYRASGKINQVTVLDTRDTDSGWNLTGSMSQFGSGANTFSGNALGWQPVVTSQSAPVGGYTQTVTAGGTVAPWTPGLGTAATLGQTPAGHGLGVASMDARLKLLIPTSAPNGTYTGVLTFTFA